MKFSEISLEEIIEHTSNEKPLVSIITVVYNGEKYLENTLKSIISQTYACIEYIIIDGGSTDETINLIRKYDKNISFWISEPDEGIYDAMNKGLKLANGQWINFINAGDTFHDNNVISEISNYFTDTDILYGNYNKVWKNRIEKIIPPQRINRFTLLKYFGINHQTIFSKKKFLKGFDCKYKIAADYNWLLETYNSGHVRFKYLNKTLINYDPYGLSNNYDTLNEFLDILKNHYGLLVFSYFMIKWKIFEILKKMKKVFINNSSKDKL